VKIRDSTRCCKPHQKGQTIATVKTGRRLVEASQKTCRDAKMFGAFGKKGKEQELYMVFLVGMIVFSCFCFFSNVR
jgi:hypothetical protein